MVIAQRLIDSTIPSAAIGTVQSQSQVERHAVDIALWFGAPIVLGAIYPNRRLAAYLGLVAALVAFIMLGATRADLPQGEWSGFGRIVENVVLIAYATLAAGLVVSGAAMGSRMARRPRMRVRGSTALHALTASGILVTALTLSMSIWLPDSRAYAVYLGPEWVSAGPYLSFDPTYGTDFQAELVTLERPDFYKPPTHPVLGVSVVSLPAFSAPLDCFHAFVPWPGNPMLTQTKLSRSGDTTLPIGPAYEWIGQREGLTFYSYSFGRERRILFDSRPLCYMLVVTVPSSSSMTEADARTIVESFRYQ
jgi:hypothetical protein